VDYQEKLQSIDTRRFKDRLRTAMQAHYPGHQNLDMDNMANTCASRALAIWRQAITPDLNIPEQREFERHLPEVKMRAGISIPRIFLFGYAFGLACHYLVGGEEKSRPEIGATSGLYMFILGMFDHLMDDYPEFFGDLGRSFSGEAIENYVFNEAYGDLARYASNPLAKGLAGLYRVYFQRCHRLVPQGDAEIITSWSEELKRMHRVEAESVDRRISSVEPDASIAEHALQPSLSAFRVLAMSASLEQPAFQNASLEQFAEAYATLSWLVDDVSDIQKDLDADIWSGLAVRLATEAEDQSAADRLIDSIADDASAYLCQMHELLKDCKWQAEDAFSIADVLWYVIWAWCGGVTEARASAVA
jgi:hypothetical protein